MVEGGTAHGLEQPTCVSSGAPLPLYIKEQVGGRPALVRPKERTNPLRTRKRIHPFLVQLGREKGEGKRGRGRGKEGPRPPPLVLFGLPLGGRHLLGCCPLSPLRPTKAQYFPGGFR